MNVARDHAREGPPPAKRYKVALDESDFDSDSESDTEIDTESESSESDTEIEGGAQGPQNNNNGDVEEFLEAQGPELNIDPDGVFFLPRRNHV